MFQNPGVDHEVSRSEGNITMADMHVHNYYELYYLAAGSREYFVEDTIFSVQAGDFVLIAPGKLHRTGGEYGMRILVCFTEEFLLRTFTKKGMQSIVRCFERLKITPPEQERGRFLELLTCLERMEDETQFAVLLAALLQELGSCEQTVLSHEGVSAMVAYINANFASITGISQIAEQFYISKFHLCRVFREAMKVTVVEYLNRVRIQNACRYLRSSEKDVAEVAMLCGFHDAAYFSNVFKRAQGVTPREYRRKG